MKVTVRVDVQRHVRDEAARRGEVAELGTPAEGDRRAQPRRLRVEYHSRQARFGREFLPC